MWRSIGDIMTAEHETGNRHAAAAAHHQQAMHYHRAASTHYEVGKDYAHAAHQALLAHGHALLAIERAREAEVGYVPSTPKKAEDRSHLIVSDAAGPIDGIFSGSAHHAMAADHHEQAMGHHHAAAEHCAAMEYVLAAHEAQQAHDHARRAVIYGDEAAKHHVEHYGRAAPTAEIA
jgi:hypothetical protein